MSIKRAELLVRRDGTVWYMPQRVDPDTPSVDRALLGVVFHEGRGRTPRRGWRFKCSDCTSYQGAVQRTRRDAIEDLLGHWNEDKTDD